ncbi:MAG: YlbF family regulator [Clostridia bacterium]|nr:YlbF family regulator [Clostridia bacterium]
MTEKIMEAIEALQRSLEESDEIKNYRKAKAAYDADSALVSKINEYNLQASLLEQEGRKPEEEKDVQLIDSIARRLRAIYEELQESEVLAAMNKAEAELTPVMNHINLAVQLAIDPDYEEHCTHDCSTCGGCH